MQLQLIELGEILDLGWNRPREASSTVDVVVGVETQRTQLREAPDFWGYVAGEIVSPQIQMLQRLFKIP